MVRPSAQRASPQPASASESRTSSPRAYRPQTNGKAERFIQSALREWAYGFAYNHSEERAAMLERWIHHYNWHRPHQGIHGTHQPPGSADHATTS
jgi:transposase InsO family protein